MADMQMPDIYSSGDSKRTSVVDAVQRQIGNASRHTNGALECVQSELNETAEILARLLDYMADKQWIDNENLVKIIRGY